MRPHRRQPTRLPHPWDSPGKNTGVGAISFSNAWKWNFKVKSLSRVRLLATPWTAAHQAPPSMGFSRQEYWNGVPLPSPYHLDYNFIPKNYLESQTIFIISHFTWKCTCLSIFQLAITHESPVTTGRGVDREGEEGSWPLENGWAEGWEGWDESDPEGKPCSGTGRGR